MAARDNCPKKPRLVIAEKGTAIGAPAPDLKNTAITKHLGTEAWVVK
jgi:hypothetical protein